MVARRSAEHRLLLRALVARWMGQQARCYALRMARRCRTSCGGVRQAAARYALPAAVAVRPSSGESPAAMRRLILF
ncbi:hypothetical protein F511_44601 [Dorcoceras hygrometricum]|uniref:Uncharacterized protein n=1 Tax=Dorcoceras hygrometricum TaxID=472368 RepID=A0A2Z7CGV8_9LAMI|nr:hypothetical protein F511_44601 [Dorcoceras hygrometricum]